MKPILYSSRAFRSFASPLAATMSAPLEDTPIKLAVTLGPAETVEASSPAIPTSKRKRAPKKPAGEATTSRIGRKGAKGSVSALCTVQIRKTDAVSPPFRN